MSEIKLLPCPFCKAELEKIEYKSDVFYRHPYNSCILSGKKVFELENDIKAWNTRKPMERIAERLEEKTEFLKDCTKYGNKNAKQQEKSYSTMMMYEVADLVEDLVDIVKEVGGIE